LTAGVVIHDHGTVFGGYHLNEQAPDDLLGGAADHAGKSVVDKAHLGVLDDKNAVLDIVDQDAVPFFGLLDGRLGLGPVGNVGMGDEMLAVL
jgi:hypothetical protein